MAHHEPRRTKCWWQTVRWAGWPLAATGLLVFGTNPLSAEHGWKFGKKSSPPPAAETRPQTNGFVTAIHKLQEEAKRRAFDGDVDGAIACAQRARKIAEASSALVAEDPECTVEAADRLVEKLMAIKSAAPVPAKPAVSSNHSLASRPKGSVPSTAPVPPHPVFAHRSAATGKSSAARPGLVPSWERPVTAFVPHPVASTVQPLAVVAVSGKRETEAGRLVAEVAPGESLEEIVQSDERTIAWLMARSRPSPSQPPFDAPASEGAAGSAPSNEQNDWPTDATVISRAVQIESEEWLADGQFQLLQQIQTAEPADSEPSPPSAEESSDVQPIHSQESTGYSEFVTEFPTAVTSANQASTAPQPQDADTVQQAALSQAATDEAVFVPTAFATSSAPALPATPPAESVGDTLLQQSLRVPTVYFREVEPPSIAPSAPVPKPVPAPPLHLAERLARALHVPARTVAAAMGGLGLILLGLGLFMARTALRPKS